jgi:hypothetical protein
VTLPDGTSALRVATASVVVAVAGFAAVISYTHIRQLALDKGQPWLDADLLPLSVDGLVLAASMVLWHEARARRDSPLLAQGMLALGVAATIAANVLYGYPHGPLAAVISAWPAVGFIGAVEMVILQVRRSSDADRAPQRDESDAGSSLGLGQPVVTAEAAFRASLAGGQPAEPESAHNAFRAVARSVVANNVSGARGVERALTGVAPYVLHRGRQPRVGLVIHSVGTSTDP